MIPYNKPYISSKALNVVQTVLKSEQLSGNGRFTKRCHHFFEKKYNFKNCYLTNSATNALEMASVLLDIGPDDEVILPSYTFVSSATPFALRGAQLVFCDSSNTTPNIDVAHLSTLITPRTKAIVIVHYAGVACDMDAVMQLVEKNNLFLIEDAAHAITAKYKDRFLGSFGHLAALSFHETKNISAGQAGMLVVNDDKLKERAELIWARGTNRLDMERGLVSKYEWVEHGSNYYPSEVTACILWCQLDEIDKVQRRRAAIWNSYLYGLKPLQDEGKISLPVHSGQEEHNHHIFYFQTQHLQERDELLQFLLENKILALFHYLPLHLSPFMKHQNTAVSVLPNAEKYGETLIRLPLFYSLEQHEIEVIISTIHRFYKSKKA